MSDKDYVTVYYCLSCGMEAEKKLMDETKCEYCEDENWGSYPMMNSPCQNCYELGKRIAFLENKLQETHEILAKEIELNRNLRMHIPAHALSKIKECEDCAG